MHTQVMEGICTAGTLEEGEVVWQVETRMRILRTKTHRQEYCCATHVCSTHSESCVHTAVHIHTAVTMLSAQRISSAVYPPAYTGDGRDLYRRNAGGR